jgi:outer membrane protein
MVKKILLTALLLVCMLVMPDKAAAEQKIAVVDVQTIISNSRQIQALNKEQEAKIAELEKWLEVVKKDVEKQQTEAGKEKLLNKYRATYEKKRADIVNSGQVKMQAIMDNIAETIQKQAQNNGYDMVITKGVVIYGGKDLTDDVLKALK